MTLKQNQFIQDIIPAEVTRVIASFLGVDCLLNFCESSSTIREDLCLHTSPRYQLISKAEWYGAEAIGYKPKRGLSIPIIASKNTLAVTLTLTCSVAIGSGKGQLYVVGHSKCNRRDFSTGRCVGKADISDSTINNLKFSFFFDKDEVYYLWCNINYDGHSRKSLGDGSYGTLSRNRGGRFSSEYVDYIQSSWYYTHQFNDIVLSIYNVQVSETLFENRTHHHNSCSQTYSKSLRNHERIVDPIAIKV